MPRRPRNGLSSGAWRRNGSGLSAPASSVRTITRRPSSASAISRSTATCSSSLGGVSRSRNRNSVRSSPTPSAPWPDGEPRLRRAADVREDLDAAPVAHRARLRGASQHRRPRRGLGVAARLLLGDRAGAGIDVDGAGRAVEHERRALGDREQRRAERRPPPGCRARAPGSRRGRSARRARSRSPMRRPGPGRPPRPASARRRGRCRDPRARRSPARRRAARAPAGRRPRRRRRARAGRDRRAPGTPRPRRRPPPATRARPRRPRRCCAARGRAARRRRAAAHGP